MIICIKIVLFIMVGFLSIADFKIEYQQQTVLINEQLSLAKVFVDNLYVMITYPSQINFRFSETNPT